MNGAQPPFPPYHNNVNYSEVIPPNNYDYNRLQTEINELKRINSEMLNRISRLENYLGVRGELNSNI